MYAEVLSNLGQKGTTRREPKQKAPWARLKMLVNLYAPDLTEQLAAFDAAREVLAGALIDGVMQGSINDAAKNARLAVAMETALNPFTHAADGMRATIVASSQALAKSAAKVAAPRRLRDRF